MSIGDRALATPEDTTTQMANKHPATKRQVLNKPRFKNMADILSLVSLTQDPTFAARISTAHPQWFAILIAFDHGLQATGQCLFANFVTTLAQGCKGRWRKAANLQHQRPAHAAKVG
jgi:hypothetical protein